MKKLLAILPLLTSSLFASATSVYVTQSGAGSANGTSLGNAFALSALSSSGNCGAGSTQIGPGTTVYLSGTFTLTNNTTGFSLPSSCSGSSGSPVLIQFMSGALWQAGYFGGTGSIVLNGDSYVILDGTGATVQNTTNGSTTATCLSGSGCSTQQQTRFLDMYTCTSCEVRNFTIQDLYIHTKCEASSGCDTTTSNSDTMAIRYGGAHTKIHDNVIHDVSWAIISYGATSVDDWEIYNNNVYNMDHGIVFGSGGSTVVISNVYIHDNHLHDMAAWDTGTADAYHHDFIHSWGNGPSSKVQNAYIYNNLFDGDEGDCCVTAMIYLEGTSGPAWTDSTGTAYLWNNVLIGSMDVANSNVYISAGTGHQFINNTLIVSAPNNGGCLGFYDGATNVIVKNNVIEGCNALENSASATSFTSIDYNTYGHASGGNNIFQYGSQNSNTFSGWKTACGCDAHSSVTATLSSTIANISSSGVPSTGFVGISAGVNLTSIATGTLSTLASDTSAGDSRSTVARPSSGSWVIGAYTFGGGGGGGGVSLVQTTFTTSDCGGPSACSTPAFAASNTAGNTILACASWVFSPGTGGSLSSVTDTLGNTYTVISTSKTASTAGAHYTEIGTQCGYATNILHGANTVTCNFGGSPTYLSCSAWELSASSFYVATAANGTTEPSITTSSLSVPAGSYAVSIAEADNGGTPALTIGSGWTSNQNYTGGSAAVADEGIANASSVSLAGTFSQTGTPVAWVDSMVVFQSNSVTSGTIVFLIFQ